MNLKSLSSLVLALALTLPAAAQFDLSSQRSEDQTVRSAAATKTQSSPFGINPRPHSLTLSGGIYKPKKQKVNIKSAIGLDGPSGAYRLTVGKKGVEILAADARGEFYARQTLRQLLDSTGTAAIPQLVINDRPDIEHRGVVEGFYGTPWSHEARLSLIDFYGRNKLNTYIYGPKDDPYHSSPNWRKPYPADQARNIHELVEACRRNYVDFVWAIHPGKDIRWTDADRDSLAVKFEMMYDLGVRAFAIFFDDIEGEGTNPYRQVELLNWLTDNFVKRHDDVADLIVCPTDYSRLWANPTERGANAIYGRELRPEIDVMYTGDFVCSDLTKDTMDFFNALIKRPGYYWWNWPVTDYARNFLLQGPAYGLDTSLTAADVAALVSNPMEHAEASKTALYGVADYAWNVAAYSPLENWERALHEMMPECPEAYRAFAIHSCDTQTGYRRDESWQTDSTTLEADLRALASAPAEIRAKCTNKALVAELDPWLTQAEALARRGLALIELQRQATALTPAQIAERLRAIEPTEAETEALKAHTLGTLRLQPAIDAIADRLRAQASPNP